ncbi:methyl-accepting chemotaxis protein [Vibrio maerlii]|uniref:methyl-accepting chemotaxis protein n=1 Tax=Vibrio maerlii TaxID=2231648 RepID=UPI000E3EDF5C|nr:methyl-accepting chemotaxis protein [Vibrio maerlii]
MKFSHKIIAASSTLLLTTVVLLSAKQLMTVRSEVQSLTNTSIQEMVNGVKNTVTAEMNTNRSLAQTTAEYLALNPNDRTYVKEVLETAKLKSSFITVGLGYESDGILLENDDNWSQDANYDPRQRPWYIESKRAGQLIVTDPYVDASTQKVIISVGMPVQERGQHVAGMFFDVDLAGLASLVNQINLLDAGEMFIVTADGTTIAHPDSKFNGENMRAYLPGVTIQEGKQNIELNGQNYLVNFTHIPSENWYVGAALSEDIVLGTVNDLRTDSFIAIIFALILSIAALTFLMRVLLRPLDTLNTAIEDVASGQGDLTKRLDTNTDAEFSRLAKSFNKFTENLQAQITESKAISSDIKYGTDLAVENAAQSAQAMNTQLEELEQLATAMNEMTVTATEVANNAQGAATAAREADEATIAGTSIVGDTTGAIDNLSLRIDQAVAEVQVLESATANIETILKVINDIADQTNLLALNAAIEAARAGESGRGFAVVADEVRTLAQRTQESTTEIRSMIEQLQNGASSVSNAMNQSKDTASEAVERAQQANDALERIRVSIQHISDMNIHIATAAEQQSLVAEEINSNTVKIKDISVQVSDAAINANEAMQQQNENVNKQNQLLNKFIV